MTVRKEGCIICGKPLVYLESEEEMTCSVCGKKVMSRARCEDGHFVCDECHTDGLDEIVSLCLAETSKDPVAIMEKMMDLPFCHMHGPEHHTMVPAALLTAYLNAGGEADHEKGLREVLSRGRKVPGGICGFCGSCGAGVGAGIFVAVITGSTPLAEEEFGLANRMTGRALEKIGEVGGPRCCKRDSYLAITAAVEFAEAEFGVKMERSVPVCTRSSMNAQCIGERCPFRP